MPAGARSPCPTPERARPAARGASGRPAAVASRLRSCATARSCGRARSGSPTTTTRARGDAGHAVPHRLDHEDVHRGRRSCSSATRASSTSTTGSSSTSTGIANGSPTIRRLLAHLSGLQREAGRDVRRRRVADRRGARRVDGDVELVLPRRQAPLLEPRVRAARRRWSRGSAGRPYTDVRRRADHRGRSGSRARLDAAGAEGAGLLRRRVRAHASGASRRPTSAARGAGPALVDRRGSRPLGDVPRERRRRRARPTTVEEMWFPQVMYDPDDWVLGWGLGLTLYNQGGRDLRRPRRRDGRAISPASSSTARRRSAPRC